MARVCAPYRATGDRAARVVVALAVGLGALSACSGGASPAAPGANDGGNTADGGSTADAAGGPSGDAGASSTRPVLTLRGARR